MARKVLVRLVDDLDGQPSTDVATVTFALDRVNYEIDLNQVNAKQLRDTLDEFIGAARRTGGRARRGAARATRTAGAAGNASAIREWARKQGHELGERGRIPAQIVQAFQAAQKTGPVEITAEKRAAKAAPGRKAAERKPAATRATKAAKQTKAAAKPSAEAKAGGKAAGAATGARKAAGTRKTTVKTSTRSATKSGTTRARSSKRA